MRTAINIVVGAAALSRSRRLRHGRAMVMAVIGMAMATDGAAAGVGALASAFFSAPATTILIMATTADPIGAIGTTTTTGIGTTTSTGVEASRASAILRP
jgi:hypothetical protein